VVADAAARILRADSTLTRAVNLVTAMNLEPTSIADAERLLDIVGDRALDMPLIYGESDARPAHGIWIGS
jgi:hypothetical protein